MKVQIHLLLIFLSISSIYAGEDFYVLLGLKRDASQKEIKKAFRSLSLKYHPDRNPGNDTAHEMFVKINRAHETLIDPELKKIYDIYGEEGLEKEHNISHQQKNRGPNAKVEMAVTLEDLYNGGSREISLEKNVICSHCHGTGGKLGKTKQCPMCQGRGMVTQNVNMMGFQMQMQQPCNKCGGKGIIFSEVCPNCKGRQVIKETKAIKVVIEKGMRDNEEIIFPRESEQSPDTIPGDLIVTLKQKRHYFFNKREGNDLYAEMELNLKEGLLGYSNKIKHLDNREFYIESKDTTQPNYVRKISNEGMPTHRFPSQKGDLYVKLKMRLPRSLNQEEKNMIKDIFSD